MAEQFCSAFFCFAFAVGVGFMAKTAEYYGACEKSLKIINFYCLILKFILYFCLN